MLVLKNWFTVISMLRWLTKTRFNGCVGFNPSYNWFGTNKPGLCGVASARKSASIFDFAAPIHYFIFWKYQYCGAKGSMKMIF